MLATSVKNVVANAMTRSGFVHPCIGFKIQTGWPSYMRCIYYTLVKLVALGETKMTDAFEECTAINNLHI